jgi:hypothetical protein
MGEIAAGEGMGKMNLNLEWGHVQGLLRAKTQKGIGKKKKPPLELIIFALTSLLSVLKSSRRLFYCVPPSDHPSLGNLPLLTSH